MAFVGDVMRATFAVMEMHMRKRPHLVVLTELVAPEQTPVAQSKTASTFAQELSLEESLLAILNDAMTRVDLGVAEHLKKVESLMSNSVH